MDDVLTWEDIVSRYPDQWVLIDDPETTPELEVVRGRVVAHDGDISKVESDERNLRSRRSAVLFTGALTEPDAAFVL